MFQATATAAAVLRPRAGAAVTRVCLLSSLVPWACGALRAAAPGGELAPAAPEAAASRCPRRCQELDEFHRQSWVLRHAADLDGLRELCESGPLDVLLLGDSITERWVRPLETMVFTEEEKLRDSGDLQAVFGPRRRVAAVGIGGDRTTELLWRLGEGGLGEAVKHCAPRAMHVLIGKNDLSLGTAPERLGASYRRLADELLALRPGSRLTLQLIMPFGSGRKVQTFPSLKWAQCPGVGSGPLPPHASDGAPGCAVFFGAANQANGMIARVASELGALGHDVESLDCTGFMTEGGYIRSTDFSDFIHPNHLGYERLSRCLRSAYPP